MILPDKFLFNNWDKYLGVVCKKKKKKKKKKTC